ncbi:hypothetical protein L1987_61316 [Smallanthus sonchifolius]|uniref:Uncharacterized protein n=1 Tax=Smallanthus sonchifolius TaxID=185202 RepID=A0ACB9DBE8_9ASTR|nr:hypothetical protein L1987_61316 [Smallanthus sonchifolius]
MVLRLVSTLVEIVFKFLMMDSTLTAEGFSRYGEVRWWRQRSGPVRSGRVIGSSRVGSEHLVSLAYRMVGSLVFVLQRCKRWVCWF